MEFYNLIDKIVSDNKAHSKWLNTLSFMENAGGLMVPISDEEGHLEEMIHQLDEFSEKWKPHAEKIIEIEKDLHIHWVNAITEEVMKPDYA
jgi:hypothetical protein